MHKLESFALACGSKISKPSINKHFFPLLSKKFICISQKSLEPSKSYDFFSDVIFHLKPFLDENDIDLIEICEPNAQPLFYCEQIHGVKNLQANYIIGKSLLFLGNLSLYTHLASVEKKKVVCPVNNDYIDIIKPYWSSTDSESYILPESDDKPLFLSQETPKTINEIYPEEIAKSVLDLLGIENNLNDLKTKYIGKLYSITSIDVVPGLYDPTPFNIQSAVNIRLDKNFDLNFLYTFCPKFTKVNLVTDQYIPIEILKSFKEKIARISFFINESVTEDEIEKTQSLGVDIKFLCKNKKKINNLRLKYIDLVIDEYKDPSLKELNISKKDDLRFLSKRNILHEGKLYNSYLSIHEGRNVSNVKHNLVFTEDLDFCRIYKENP